ncbi:peptidase [Actinoplanes sp. NBRC 14428]|nr:peptidase [Actinoplanes sp. NBRC 14428]
MRRVLAFVVVLFLAGCSGGTDPSSRAEGPARAGPAVFGPGAAGVGDPYFPESGNGGFDVAGYDLRLRYTPEKDLLSGTATIKATATQDLSRFQLDLTGLAVRAVTVNGVAAASRTGGGELVVTPAAGLRRGSAFTTVVRYAGRPVRVRGGEGWHRTSAGAYAQGGFTSASTWFPVNGHPSDKATFALRMTVPKGMAAVSNGVPGRRTKSRGTVTWRWSVRKPMASHRAFVAIGDYRVTPRQHRGRPVVTAVPAWYPGTGALDRTAEIADFLATRFGPYPFDAYEATAVGVPPADPGLVARDLARQWFGNSVSVRGWQDVWLSEGFAVYAQWLWSEHAGGPDVDESARDLYDTYPWQALPALNPGVKGLASQGPGVRGALTLHALQRRIGDERFFGLLRAWAAGHAYGTVTTADFVAAAEQASGQDLAAFFDVWLSGRYRPTY